MADTRFFSAANVAVCEQAGIVPLIAMKRERHHEAVLERFAEPPPLPNDADAAAATGASVENPKRTRGLRLAQADRRAGVRHHQACDEIPPVSAVRRGTGQPRMEPGRPRMESQAHERVKNSLTAWTTCFRLQKDYADSNLKRIIGPHTSACMKKRASPYQNLLYCRRQSVKSDRLLGLSKFSLPLEF